MAKPHVSSLFGDRVAYIRRIVYMRVWCEFITADYLCHEINVKRKERKVLPEPQGPLGGADLRFFSPQPDTSLHCQTTDMGLVHRAVCLFTSQLSLVLIAPTRGGMARVSWPGWLVIYRNGLPACRRSPIQVLYRARHWLTSLMRPTTLPTEPNAEIKWYNMINITLVFGCYCESFVITSLICFL